MSKKTRFRAYQLRTPGSSFSYSVDNHFTLIEARLNDVNAPNIVKEMETAGCNEIDCLHITSWDQDHCNDEELKSILKYLKPKRIDYPGYIPDTECGKKSLQLIKDYCSINNAYRNNVSPDYIDSLETGERLKFSNIVYNPVYYSDNHNDNSIVQLFRAGRFTVLSLGDCEDTAIAHRIMGCGIAANETDILVLAHHGADNGFTSKEFIQIIRPQIAICSSDFNNQYEHPRQEIRDLLYKEGITLFTTKTGDIVISCGEDNQAKAFNLKNNSEDISSTKKFRPKCTVC